LLSIAIHYLRKIILALHYKDMGGMCNGRKSN
jgi:hypothetical protein